MATDAQKNYRRAFKRTEAALDQLDNAKGIFDAKRKYRELQFAIETLLASKLALLREPKEEEPEKPKRKHRLLDQYFK